MRSEAVPRHGYSAKTTCLFAGELLQVRAEEREWEGAIERLLHNFGLSLLVRDVHYSRVAEWVDRTHLGGRLVYFRVLKVRAADHAGAAPGFAGAQDRDQAGVGFLRSGWTPSWRRASTTPAARRSSSSAANRWLSHAPARSKGGESATRRTIATASTTARASCWAGPTSRRSPRSKLDQHRLETRRAPLLDRIRDPGTDNGTRRRSAIPGSPNWQCSRASSELDWRPLVTEIERLERERRELEEGSDILRTLQAAARRSWKPPPKRRKRGWPATGRTRPARKNGANRRGNCSWRATPCSPAPVKK